jgi:hypothetical protein
MMNDKFYAKNIVICESIIMDNLRGYLNYLSKHLPPTISHSIRKYDFRIVTCKDLSGCDFIIDIYLDSRWREYHSPHDFFKTFEECCNCPNNFFISGLKDAYGEKGITEKVKIKLDWYVVGERK